jgi:hypothetical protein
MSFKDEFKDANTDFTAFHNELLKHIRGDQIIDIETADTKLAKLFDVYSGVDAIQVVDKQLRTIALRVQWGNAWNTFTIRFKRASGAETEYQKRVKAIFGNKGYIYPYLTVQAYLDKRNDAKEILSCCVVRTEDLYKHIIQNMPNIRQRVCNEGNVFLYVDFDDLIKNKKIETVYFGSFFEKLNKAA